MGLLSLIGRLSLNTDNFEAGLKKAESSASAFSTRVTATLGAAAAAALSTTALKVMVDQVHDAEVEVGKLARQYGITTDEVQRLQKAAGKLGLEFGDVSGAIERIQKARAEAAQGGAAGQKVANAFNQLGVSDRDIVDMSKSAVDLLRQIGRAAAENKDSLNAQNAEFELLGKSATVIKNVLVQLDQLGPVKLFDEQNIADAEAADRLVKARQKEITMRAAPISAAWDQFKIGYLGGLKNWWDYPTEQGWSKFDLKSGASRGFSPILAILDGIKEVISPDNVSAPALSEFNKLDWKRKHPQGYFDAAVERMRATQEAVAAASAARNPYSAIKPGSGSLANIGGFFFGDQANASYAAKSATSNEITAKAVVSIDQRLRSIEGEMLGGGQP